MGKGWGPGTAGAVYTGRSCRSTAPSPYAWPPTDKPNAACTRASGAPSSACEPRWILGTMDDVEAVVVHLLPAAAAGPTPTIVPALGYNTSQ